MWVRRVRSGPRRASGTASIRRDSYFTKDGMNTRTGWYEIQNTVSKRSGGRCEAQIGGQRCTNSAKEVHHITPLSRGGANSVSNCIHLCSTCHDRRHHHLFRGRRK